MHHIVYDVVLSLAFLGIGLLFKVGQMKQLRRENEVFAASLRTLQGKLEAREDQAKSDEAIAESVRKDRDKLWSKCTELEQQLSTALRQRNEYRDVIVGVQGERDTWRDLYYSQAAGHDTAQALLMRNSERLAQAYFVATGKRPPEDLVALEARRLFVAAHGSAVAEYRDDRGAAKAAETAERETATIKAIEGGRPDV